MYIRFRTTERASEIKRKIYQRLLNWEKQQLGHNALPVEGARRLSLGKFQCRTTGSPCALHLLCREHRHALIPARFAALLRQAATLKNNIFIAKKIHKPEGCGYFFHFASSKEEWWLGTESNRRHADFQSAALPTELPSRLAKKAELYRPFLTNASLSPNFFQI